MKKTDDWLFEIKPKTSLFDLNLKEIIRYSDLLFLFVKRDVVIVYKQTILGPLWYLIQPLLTSVIFTLVFNKIGNIETGTIPPFLFNLAGITAWNYFKECFVSTSDTFKKNENIFGKVYFPRVIMPMSVVISNLLKFAIQLSIFVFFYIYYVVKGFDATLNYNTILLLPIIVISMGIIGLGLGMIISSMVTKYRDLTFLVTFGVQLLSYISAVMYPVKVVKEKIPSVAWLVEYNPLTVVINTFRDISFGVYELNVSQLLKLIIFSFIIFIIGLLAFNKTEKSFIDTI